MTTLSRTARATVDTVSRYTVSGYPCNRAGLDQRVIQKLEREGWILTRNGDCYAAPMSLALYGAVEAVIAKSGQYVAQRMSAATREGYTR